MRGIQFQRFGGPEVLEPIEIPTPTPGPNECLVRLWAAGVNPLEYKIRSGKMRLIFPVRRPHIPGTDICGRIEEVGAKVEGFETGTWVVGKLDPKRGGAYAEWAAAPGNSLFAKPTDWTPEQGAALPVAGLTALQGLRDRGRLRPGQRVLVNGASGGVGHLAVQIAAAIGAQVSAVCGPDNQEWVGALGAHRVLDYTRVDFTREGETYDLVFDAVATSSFARCRRALTRGGTYVTTVPSAGLLLGWLPHLSGKRGRAVMVKSRAADFAFLHDLAERGQLRPKIDRVFPLDEAADAQELSARGRVKGKLILRIRDTPETGSEG